jgi:hypothetical protein
MFANNPKRNPREQVDRDSYFRVVGPLDTIICPTEAETSKVAAEACRLRNKVPMAIMEEAFACSRNLFVQLRDGTQNSY